MEVRGNIINLLQNNATKGEKKSAVPYPDSKNHLAQTHRKFWARSAQRTRAGLLWHNGRIPQQARLFLHLDQNWASSGCDCNADLPV
ncbi:hypothetical protein ROHU_006585 [Labeo rohita]|uniref:Uncharacterized protein n=1 Tax=Labeo rohita TaxID=84645 RepID=A0A498MT68_LABRO|nr:hypothetical protein ROHU_006585 [Labeo rohita]